jgi:hypothetical protein
LEYNNHKKIEDVEEENEKIEEDSFFAGLVEKD